VSFAPTTEPATLLVMMPGLALLAVEVARRAAGA
jgi:hypothetical protein